MQLEEKNNADIHMYQNKISRLKEANRDYALEILKQDSIVSQLEQNRLQVRIENSLNSLSQIINSDFVRVYSISRAKRKNKGK